MPRKAKDLTNKQFGLWFVIKRDYSKNKTSFICRCKCGVVHSVRADLLVSGKSKGCLSCVRTSDLQGKTFGSWLVLSAVKENGMLKGWLCKCQKCGVTKIVNTGNLTSGQSTQCRKCGTHRTHGKTSSRLYTIYRHMINRCYCVTDKNYKNYGARNITICQEWLNDFNSFYEWSLANGYKVNLTIDRIDVNQGYSPNNCRWTTIQEQQRTHKRSLTELTFNNETKCLSEWARATGLHAKTIKYRLLRGWSVERTLTTPPLTGSYAKKQRSQALQN